MFPSDLPKSITLQAQRIDASWPEDWSNSFDYVHQRLVLPGCENCSAATAVKNICALVKPGGWIELLEQDHNSPNPGAFDKAEEMIREIFTVNGFGFDYPLHMKDWLEAAGMEDIRQEVFDVPVGALNPNPELAWKSTWQISSAIAGFLPMARALPLSMPRDELDNLPKYTENEMNRVGGVQRIYVVYGRKPMED
ncbi:methyltransferase -like [Trichoderma arundinaceum]|uniref:Methyltransferase-like n=1 Tax=Trichoderma arundinaceum TaxID=490622 RepID=A0A395NP87_TRIAR|nr:methyltransferase -like [Trichoderma arundinaceum]